MDFEANIRHPVVRELGALKIIERIERIASIGDRIGYSPAEDAAHELAAGWMAEAGLDVSRDEAGNLFGRRGDARVWTGSHLDSVPNGGRFDGVLGVLAGIEAAARLPDASLAVVAFRAEENGPMGSRALTELPEAFVEVHIEQGPVLERAGEPLGVVTAIAGQARGAVVFEGRADHAGHDADGRARRRAGEGGAVHPPRRRVRARRRGGDGRRRRGRAERDERRPRARHGVGRRARARARRSSTSSSRRSASSRRGRSSPWR